VADVDSKYRPHFESLLESGEELRGICVCSQQKGMFKGGAVAIGATDRRLLVQPVNRRGDPDGAVDPIPPERIASVKAGGAGGGWWTVSTAILDHAAVKLEIETTDGEKLKLMVMRSGAEPLAEWFRANEPT
jgi:hypothetical protein